MFVRAMLPSHGLVAEMPVHAHAGVRVRTHTHTNTRVSLCGTSFHVTIGHLYFLFGEISVPTFSHHFLIVCLYFGLFFVSCFTVKS